MQRGLPLLLTSLVLGTGGCSFLPYQASPVNDPDTLMLPTDTAPPAPVPATHDRVAAIQRPPICPPLDNTHRRIRDLTRPWRDRCYLLPDGHTCRPAGGER